MGLETHWMMLGKFSQRTQCYGHCWIRCLLNCWLLKGCFPFPVTSHIAGLLNSSFSTPKLRNPFGTMYKAYYMGRKADEMLTVQPSTFLKCHKYCPWFLVLQLNTPIREAPDLKLQTPPPHTPLMGGVGRFHTFNGFGYKMWWGFGFFHSVSLHNLTFFIESQEPRSSGFLLPIQRGRINNVVVFKDGFLKFALWCENILQWEREKKKQWKELITDLLN